MEESHRFGDIAEIFRGRNPGRNEFTTEGAFVLKVGSLAGSFISWRERKRGRVALDWFARATRTQLRPGDICFTGTAHRPSYIGLKVDLVSDIPEPGAVASGEVVVVRLHDDAPMDAVSLLYYLRSAEGYSALQSRIRGSSAHIYPKDLVDMPIPNPSSLFDTDRVGQLHFEAESAFRRYLEIEDQIGLLVGPPDVED
jgi:hypothetical protein